MSGVTDGATTRRERLLDLIQYIKNFPGEGATLDTVKLYMSMAHGLSAKRTQEYVYEMQQGGIVTFLNGRLKVNRDNFRRLMELMAPDRDPETGRRRSSDIDLELLNGGEDEELETLRPKKPGTLAV